MKYRSCKLKTKHPSTSRNWPRLWINTLISLRKIKCMSLHKKSSSCLIVNNNLKNMRKPSSYFCVVSKDYSLFSLLKTMRPSAFWTIRSNFTKLIQTCGIWKKEVTFYLTQIKFTSCSTSSKSTENTSTMLGFWKHSKTNPSQKIYFSIWSSITCRETISQKLNLMCLNLILDLWKTSFKNGAKRYRRNNWQQFSAELLYCEDFSPTLSNAKSCSKMWIEKVHFSDSLIFWFLHQSWKVKTRMFCSVPVTNNSSIQTQSTIRFTKATVHSTSRLILRRETHWWVFSTDKWYLYIACPRFMNESTPEKINAWKINEDQKI